MISSDVQFEDISASDEYDSINPSAILITGQFSFEEMKYFIQNTISTKAKFYLIWKTTYLILFENSINSIDQSLQSQIKMKFGQPTKICLKTPSSINELYSNNNIQSLLGIIKFLRKTCYYLFLPKSSLWELHNIETFSHLLTFQPNNSNLILFEYDSYSDLLTGYLELIWCPVYAISPRFIRQVNKLLTSENFLNQINFSNDFDLNHQEIIEQKSNEVFFPLFEPLKHCVYLSFEEISCKEPRKINNSKQIYPLPYIQDIQINHIKELSNEKSQVFEHPKTFIGFSELFGLYQGYHYFSTVEPKLNLKIESQITGYEKYSKVSICNDLYYIELHQMYENQIEPSCFYCLDTEQIFYCGQDEYELPVILVSFRLKNDFENAIDFLMRQMKIEFNIEDLIVEVPNETDKKSKYYIQFTVRSSNISDLTEDEYIRDICPKLGSFHRLEDHIYRVTTDKAEYCDQIYSALKCDKILNLLYPHDNIPHIKLDIEQIKSNEKYKPIECKIPNQQLSSQKVNNHKLTPYEEFQFHPKPSLYYIQFQESEKSKTPYHSTQIRTLFSIKNIKDVQRNFYLPNDPVEYSFMGFSNRTDFNNAFHSSLFRKTVIANSVKEYIPPNNTSAHAATKTNIFKPKTNLFYIFVEENPKSKPLKPSKGVRNAFGLKNVKDLQRNYYLPDDSQQIIEYSFIGFRTKAEAEQAKLSRSFLSCIVSNVYDYQPMPIISQSAPIQTVNTPITPTSQSSDFIQNSNPTDNSVNSTIQHAAQSLRNNNKYVAPISEPSTIRQITKKTDIPITKENSSETPNTEKEKHITPLPKSNLNKTQKTEKTIPETRPSQINLNMATNNEKKPLAKKLDKDTFKPDESLIYIFFKEKNLPPKIQSVKQEKKNLFGVKDCENVQRYKYHPTKNDGIMYTFFGFLSYSKAEQNITFLNAQYQADGPIEIYETTEALEEYKAEKTMPPKNPVICQPKESPLKSISVNMYSLIDKPRNENSFFLIKDYLPTGFTDDVINNLQSQGLIDQVHRNVIITSYLDCLSDYVVVHPNRETLRRSNQILYQIIKQREISISNIISNNLYAPNFFGIYEGFLPSKSIEDFISFVTSLQGFARIDRNVYTSCQVITLIYFTDEKYQPSMVSDISDYLIDQGIGFNQKKYHLAHTITINERLLFNNNNQYFDLIINEIKALNIHIEHVHRNALFVHNNGILLKSNILSILSCIVLKSEKDKMTALNHINSIIYRNQPNILQYKKNLFYSRFEFRREKQEIQNKMLAKLKHIHEVKDIQTNVFSIESSAPCTYVGFEDDASRKNAYGQLYLYYSVLNMNQDLDVFIYHKQYHYISIWPNLLDTAKQVSKMLQIPIVDIQQNCFDNSKEKSVLTYIGFKTNRERYDFWNCFSFLPGVVIASIHNPSDMKPDPEHYLYFGIF